MKKPGSCIGAVDIGGTKIAVGIVTPQGTVLSQLSFATANAGDCRQAMAAIADALEECRRASQCEIGSIGVGCTGPVDPLTGIVGRVALLPGWHGCPLVAGLREITGIAVAMENDADAAALAEFIWGSGRNSTRFLYVTVSTGIGAGFVCDGQLYRGTGGAHPEMGHHAIDPKGPACYCGCRGCWESLASGPAIEAFFLDDLRTAGLAPQSASAQSIFQLAAKGDPVARITIERFLDYLGIGLANLTTMLVPDVIALGGGVMNSMKPYLSRTRQFVQRRCGEVPSTATSIRFADLKSNVGLVGAAAVAMLRVR